MKSAGPYSREDKFPPLLEHRIQSHAKRHGILLTHDDASWVLWNETTFPLEGPLRSLQGAREWVEGHLPHLAPSGPPEANVAIERD